MRSLYPPELSSKGIGRMPRPVKRPGSTTKPVLRNHILLPLTFASIAAQVLKTILMAGIYVHIPFCRVACYYCNFHFSVSLKTKNDLLEALLKEATLRKDYLGGESIGTVYLGGGTPSLMEGREIAVLMDQLRAHFTISPGGEITLEANPDDINATKLEAWKTAGINRLSIGIQSFFEEDLRWMNRAHSAEQAKTCVPLAQEQGFNNISIDLIYGSPGLTDEKWMENIRRAIDFKLPHLSCYALTVEPGTALQTMIHQHKKKPVEPEQQARQFLILVDELEKAGYEHYEISNFAKPGQRSRHNSSYWAGVKYLGLGPSAHSFNGQSRQWNIAHNPQYIKAMQEGAHAFEKEELTSTQKVNEYIMTALRTMEGLDLARVETHFGKDRRIAIQQSAKKFLETNRLKQDGSRLQLTREGKLFADGIAADLFFLE
jgi:oxygen-independent coproporphyrinogen-3 oxidase